MGLQIVSISLWGCGWVLLQVLISHPEVCSLQPILVQLQRIGRVLQPSSRCASSSSLGHEEQGGGSLIAPILQNR